jgi:Sulfotransferase family
MSVPPPIFVLASQRSFTSLVCTMIGQHPEAYGVPEINLFVKETLQQLVQSSRRDRQFMVHGLWRTVAQLYFGEQTIETVEAARRWVTKRMDCSTTDVFRELCVRVAPLRVVDKSPAYCKKPKAMQRIQQGFPDAYYLFMTRHPVDQGKSVMGTLQAITTLLASDSLDYSTSPPTVDPQFEWYDTQKRILDFLQTVPKDQQFFLRGEDLLNQPQQYLQQICAWLNLSWSDEIYAQMLKTEESPYACMGPYTAQWGNNPGFQKSPAFRYKPLKLTSIEGPLPWRPDQKGLTPEVLQLAHELGY